MQYELIEFETDAEEAQAKVIGVRICARQLLLHGLYGTPHCADVKIREDHPTWTLREIGWDGLTNTPVFIYDVTHTGTEEEHQ